MCCVVLYIQNSKYGITLTTRVQKLCQAAVADETPSSRHARVSMYSRREWEGDKAVDNKVRFLKHFVYKMTKKLQILH